MIYFVRWRERMEHQTRARDQNDGSGGGQWTRSADEFRSIEIPLLKRGRSIILPVQQRTNNI